MEKKLMHKEEKLSEYDPILTNKSELFHEMDKHLKDDKPSDYFNSLMEVVLKVKPFYLLYELKNTEQSKIHHPEGNVWNHTMLVIDEAAKVKYKSKNSRVFMWAALLHDIGKPSTTRNKKGKITAYNHDFAGEKKAEEFLKEFVDDNKFITEVCILVKWHMQILYVVKGLPFAKIDLMMQQVDLEEIALLGFCDRMGRTEADWNKEKKNIEVFKEKCRDSVRL